MTIDLNAMGLKELRDLQGRVSKAIATFEERKKKEAVAELEEIARARGFSFAELAGLSMPRKRAPATTKYVNPDDAAQTWSGRGRKPRWFEAALKAGKSLSDLSA